jgi:hypothetical protein
MRWTVDKERSIRDFINIRLQASPSLESTSNNRKLLGLRALGD